MIDKPLVKADDVKHHIVSPSGDYLTEGQRRKTFPRHHLLRLPFHSKPITFDPSIPFKNKQLKSLSFKSKWVYHSILFFWFSCRPYNQQSPNIEQLDVCRIVGIRKSQWRGIAWQLRRSGLLLANGDLVIVKGFVLGRNGV